MNPDEAATPEALERGGDPAATAAESLRPFEVKLGYSFVNRALLRHALTHSSSTTGKLRDNERMELLGDAILGMIVCEHLYRAHPQMTEGELTEIKSAVVQRETLTQAARELGVRPFLILGKGVAQRRELPASILANVFEALVAAIYLDDGYAAARDFSLSALADAIAETLARPGSRNYKSILQQLLQQRGGAVPDYQVVGESGPDHNKSFEVAALVAGAERGRGRGANKKEAEQAAARAALVALKALQPEEL